MADGEKKDLINQK